MLDTRRLILSILIMFALFGASIAGANESENSYFLFKNYKTRSDRLKFADLILQKLHISEFDNIIPRISPSQNEWIEGELNSGNMNRIGDLLRSKEYITREAGNYIRSLDIFIASIKGMPESEMAFWVRTAYLLSNRGFSEYVGIYCVRFARTECPLVGKDQSLDVPSMVSEMIARTIILGVIGPHFNAGF